MFSREIAILSDTSFPVYGPDKITISFGLCVAMAGNINFGPNRPDSILDVRKRSENFSDKNSSPYLILW